MTDREKLIELLENISENHAPCGMDVVADQLLANGVTFATDTNDGCKWISVEDRLPKRSEYNFNEYIVKVVRSHWPTSSYDVIDAPYDEEYTTCACYDHDQKVWHLSRSEVILNALLKPEDAAANSECVTHWMPMPT